MWAFGVYLVCMWWVVVQSGVDSCSLVVDLWCVVCRCDVLVGWCGAGCVDNAECGVMFRLIDVSTMVYSIGWWRVGCLGVLVSLLVVAGPVRSDRSCLPLCSA